MPNPRTRGTIERVRWRFAERVEMNGFYWLIPNVLAGCGRPGRIGRTAGRTESLEDDLAWLKLQGVQAVLSLTETPLESAPLARVGLASLHLPVTDMTPPSPAQFREAIDFIEIHRAHGRPVAVHCLVGQGRTGSVLAAYLIRHGYDPERALAELRVVCPGAVENPKQEAALAQFAERRDWLI